jgi:hypothetical protein
MYERNVRALGGDPVPPSELAPEPPGHVTRAFEAAFEESRKDATAAEVAKPEPPSPDARAARVREAFDAGRISRETYETNLRALGELEAVNPPPPPPEDEPIAEAEPVPDAPVANPPASPGLPPGFEERVAVLARLLSEGKMSKEIYERNLARTYEAVDPRLAQLRSAHEGGRISKDVYDANVRRVMQARGAP